jgi:hypothetical protein
MYAESDEVGAVEGRGVAGGERFLGFLRVGVREYISLKGIWWCVLVPYCAVSRV